MSFLFPYFGSKYRLAKEYPPPQSKIIVEPFAGGAGYASRWYDRDVYLFDRNPLIISLWKYLIRVSGSEIRSLPLLHPECSVADLPIIQEAKWLIGFWTQPGDTHPNDRFSSWAKKKRRPNDSSYWGVERRAKLASRVEVIKHWKAAEALYVDLPNGPFTWYVDPPISARAETNTSSGKSIIRILPRGVLIEKGR